MCREGDLQKNGSENTVAHRGAPAALRRPRPPAIQSDAFGATSVGSETLWTNALEELDRAPPPAQGPPAKRVRFGDSEVREFSAPSAPSEGEVEVHAGKLFAWQCRSDASAGWRHRGIEMIFEAARDKGIDLYDCYVSQCFYERGKPGPSSTTWRILTNAKQLYYKLRREGARDILGMRRSLKNRWSRRAWSRTLWMQ